MPALVVGDTEGMSESLQAQFRTTGLTHLTAVSGANLTLLLAAILWAAARAGVVGWWRRGVALAGVVAFVLLCRAEPSVLRAAAMGLVGLAALGWGGTQAGPAVVVVGCDRAVARRPVAGEVDGVRAVGVREWRDHRLGEPLGACAGRLDAGAGWPRR